MLSILFVQFLELHQFLNQLYLFVIVKGDPEKIEIKNNSEIYHEYLKKDKNLSQINH